MILNEDFFNDVEIKDDDLTVELQPVEEYNEKTSRELIEHNMSESEMVLMINIYKFPGGNIWHRIERIMKRLKYMFNIYNINLSEPFITYKRLSYYILTDKNFPDKEENYTITQHEGCNLYFPEDMLRKYGPDITIKNLHLEVFVFLDKKLPVFKTAMSVYNFLIGLDKCLWKDVTDPKDDCFRCCDFYDIDNVYNGDGFISTYSFKNSYIHNDGTWVYNNVLNIVPKELAELLKKKKKLLQFANKLLNTDDVKTIIKMTKQ